MIDAYQRHLANQTFQGVSLNEEIKFTWLSIAFFQVIGVGGGGSNAVNRMLSGKLEGVDLFIINTDAQAGHFFWASSLYCTSSTGSI